MNSDDTTKGGVMGGPAATGVAAPAQPVTDPMTDPVASAAPVTPPVDDTMAAGAVAQPEPVTTAAAVEPVEEPMGTTTMMPSEAPMETPVAPATGVASTPMGMADDTTDETETGTGTGSQTV